MCKNQRFKYYQIVIILTNITMTNKEIVEKLLKENPLGLTIQELSNKAKVTRNTIVIILAELKGESRIVIRQVGQAKLHSLKEK